MFCYFLSFLPSFFLSFFLSAPTDDVSGLHGPIAQHDLPLRSRNVPNVRRSHVRVPDLPEGSRKTHPALLDLGRYTIIRDERVVLIGDNT
jgi:hypothetical protein